MKRRTSPSALRLVRRRLRATARTTADGACRNIRCRRSSTTPCWRRKESSTERFSVRVRRTGRPASRRSAASRARASQSGASSEGVLAPAAENASNPIDSWREEADDDAMDESSGSMDHGRALVKASA